jgi:hypothetical protein
MKIRCNKRSQILREGYHEATGGDIHDFHNRLSCSTLEKNGIAMINNERTPMLNFTFSCSISKATGQ